MIYAQIMEGVKLGQAERVIELCLKALSEGYSALSILEKGLIMGIDEIANKYCQRRVVVPEVLLSARAMHAGLSVIEPHLKKSKARRTGTIVIGTVAGDLHDIGKNLVKLMVKSTGASVVDLGINVTPQKFLKAVEKENAEIVMMAALLTTTMPVMKQVIIALEEAGLRDGMLVGVGGAPLDETFAREIGADCYFKCATDVKEFLELNLNKIVLRRKKALLESYKNLHG